MNHPEPNLINTLTDLPAIGTPMEGGYFFGAIIVDQKRYGLVVPPKAEGQTKPAIWIPDYKDVPGAKSFNDGHANTIAMADAGSNLAKMALDSRIGGHDDWYLPAIDELELAYRLLKPNKKKNYCYMRSGINLNSAEIGAPYTPDFPGQTLLDLFKQGGAEAFDLEVYWSSTQSASDSLYAWGHGLDDGFQNGWSTDSKLRARFVRRFTI